MTPSSSPSKALGGTVVVGVVLLAGAAAWKALRPHESDPVRPRPGLREPAPPSLPAKPVAAPAPAKVRLQDGSPLAVARHWIEERQDPAGGFERLVAVIRAPASTRDGRFRRCEAVRLLPYVGGDGAFVLLRSLLREDPDPWVRASAVAALVGLRLYLPDGEDDPPDFRPPLAAPARDPLRASFLDRTREDADVAREFLEARRGTPDPALTRALLGAARLLAPSPPVLEILKDTIAAELNPDLASQAAAGLRRFPPEQAAAAVDAALKRPERRVAAQALRVAAELGFESRGLETSLSEYLRLPAAALDPEADAVRAGELKGAAADAVVTFGVRRGDAACGGLIREALRPGGEAGSQRALADSLAAAEAEAYVPELRRALESAPDFGTRDALARSLTLLDPAYAGPPSIQLEIERLKKRLETEPLTDAGRKDLSSRLAERQTEYAARMTR
jgi:hypothetical protein